MSSARTGSDPAQPGARSATTGEADAVIGGKRPWLDRMIPSGLRAQGPETLLRVRLVMLVPVPFLVAAIPAATEYYLGGSPGAAIAIAVFSGAALLTPAVLRFGLAAAAHFQLALFVAVMAVLAWMSGGLGTPPLYAYVLIPIVGVALLSPKAAVVWSGLACAVVAGFLVQDQLFGPPPSVVSREALRRGHAILEILGIGVALAFTLVFEFQRRRGVAALQQSRLEAEAANRAKSAFLANVSHELRTPMNGVLGMSSLLQRAEIAPAHRDMVDVIQKSAESLLVLLDDVLDYSQLEAGHLRVVDAPFDVQEVLAETVRLMDPLAEGKGLRLLQEIERSVPPRLVGDATRIRQILVNLLGNAIKYTEAGEVRLRAEARPHGESATLVLRVEDTGPGMPEDARARIFERFERLDPSSNRRHPGSGLGLAICRGLLDLIGGEIDVESVEGKGSCFTVTVRLPVAPAEVAESAAAASLQQLPDGLQVLVVEDNPVNQLVVRQMLETMGCSVTVAADGAKALAGLSEQRFAAVVMDCHMPGMDGFAATRAIRATAETAALPVIGLTASVTADDRRQCFEAGMDTVLAKPCTIDQLQEALATHCFMPSVRRNR